MAEPYDPYQTTYGMPPKRTPLKIIAIIILILIGLTLAYFSLKGFFPSTIPASVVPIITQPTFNFNAVLASSIAANLSSFVPGTSTLAAGAPLLMYLEAENFKQNNGAVDISEDLEIKDASGTTTFAQRNFASNKNKYSQKITIVKFSNTIPTKGWKAGTYTAKLVMYDAVAGTSLTKTISFTIANESQNGVRDVVDIRSILGNDPTHANLKRQQTVWGPNGAVIPELTYSQIVVGDISSMNLSNVVASFTLPARYDAGSYTVEITYTNTDTNQSVSVKKQFSVMRQLTIEQMLFADFINDNFAYQQNVGASYVSGSTIYVYTKLTGFMQKSVQTGYTINMVEGLEITDANGNIVAQNPSYITVSNTTLAKVDSWQTKTVFKASLLPGTYRLKLTITDKNANTEAVKEESFTIR